MTKLAASVALDAKVFVRQFRALISVAEALEEIGDLEKYKSEGEASKRKLAKELENLAADVAHEAFEFNRLKAKVKAEGDAWADRSNLEEGVRKTLLEDAKNEAGVIVNNARFLVKSIVDDAEQVKVDLNEEVVDLKREKNSLEKKLSKLKREMDELKARF